MNSTYERYPHAAAVVIDPAAFIRANTRPGTAPLVPEITLQLTAAMASLRKQLQYQAEGHAHLPYWSCAWPGGQAVARYVLDRPELVEGKSVLDFGAGSGLIAIAAALAGARKVLAADTDPFAVAAIAMNAAANAVSVEATGNDIVGQDGKWDTILLGDMFYEPVLAQRLLDWLSERTAHGTNVLVGDAGRNCFPDSGLEKLQSYSVTTSRDLEESDYVVTGVYRLCAR